MSVAGSMAPGAVSHATLDHQDRLVAAEPALDSLNRRAGGGPGLPIAVPGIATVARLARRLGIVVARSVVVADEDGDIELSVRAQPDAEGVRLTVAGWREQAAWSPVIATAAARRDFLEAEADWRWETDASLRLTRVPIAAGVDATALLGQPITGLFALEGEDGTPPLLDALARREALAAQRARVRGGGAEVTLAAEVRRDAAGGFAGFIGIARLAKPEAAAAPSITESFAAGLDRALRRPLARIAANADSIHAAHEGPLAADYADYAADIAHAARHLLAMVDDLVDLQAVERADFAPAADIIDLADVARRAAGLLAGRAGETGVAIERPLADAKAMARGDFRRSVQIVVNLIGNAVRYAPRGSIVRVRLHRLDTMVAVSIADTGKGIALADQARVFDKFERVDPSEPGGNGLGLYIARRLARAMGGDLTLESAPGEGARFTLTLPAA